MEDDIGLFCVPQTHRMLKSPFEDEKPAFHTNQNPSGPSEAFVLSGSIQVPYTINRYLRDYQREGVKFIYDSYSKSRGCILGDDMGLGKTIQVISCLAAILQKTGTWKDVENNRPEFLLSQMPSNLSKVKKKVFLIVAPLSVLYNWKDELDTWGHFKTVVVHGVKKEEELARVNRGRFEIVLTTFETLRLCLDEFNSLDWAAVIVDEVHKLKNIKSQITQAMKGLKCKVRVGLTGTILQNNLEELWCVMDWANPGCLGSLGSFKNRFSEPIEQGQKHSATKRALAEGRKAVQVLAKILCRSFLRRTKALITDQLPKKDDRVVFCSMTDFQQAVYRAVLNTDDVRLLLQSSVKCPCNSGRSRQTCCYKLTSDGVPVRHIYFSYLAILRKIANHVALLQSKEGTSKKQEKYVAAICDQVFKKFPDFTERCKEAAFEAMSDPIYSGKMKVLQRLLNHFITRKDKVLLFSLSTKLLDVLENFCMAEGLEYRRLDGTTKSKDRIHIVKEFNSTSDINICLVSTMAGGLGLNFVGANVVILFDPTWNPANDLQAIDRAYRIGQCKDVKVFRFISLGTVEEIIYLRQIYKQQLQSSVIGNENAKRYFEAVQGADGQTGELFGIRNLFRLQTDGTCLTRRILEREGSVELGIMTTSTQAMDEKVQELDPVCVSTDPSGQQGNIPSSTYGTSARFSNAKVLEFSSSSEDEDPCSSRSKATYGKTEEEFRPNTAANMNLSALLMKHMTNGIQRSSESSEDSQSDTEPKVLNLKESKVAKGKTDWFLSSDSEEEMGKAKKVCDHDCMEESEERELHHSSYTKAQPRGRDGTKEDQRPERAVLAIHKQRYNDEVESFDSSEDEAPVRRVKFKKSIRRPFGAQNSAKKSVQFTGLKWPTVHSRKPPITETNSTIDTLLGGFQEVSYTHSNQKVVGSSRAENHLSRAALRDVFELSTNSQLPANHLHDTSELSEPKDGYKEVEMPEGHDKTFLKHQVTHTIKPSIHTKSATISVGETPAAVRKQQLEEMARFFKAKSVQEFAEELVKCSSAQRLSRLCEFYSHSSPELADIIQKTFSKPVTELKPSISPPTAACSTSRKSPTSKKTLVNSVQRTHDETETGTSRKIRRTKAQNAKDVYHHSAGQTELKNNCLSLPDSKEQNPSSSKDSQTNANACNSNTTSSTTEFPLLSKDTRADKNSNTTLSDLIGDTSILDDFFKQKRSTTRPKPATAPIPSPTERAKSRCKDFWDILNEENEESINKLTDLTQVEKLCRTVNVSAKPKSESQLENSQLWKKNEKFLWKR
ncbi:DNA excision repair protein ERCC-6-like 2 isoform X2 [Silurus meridionalis]|uniref:DNA excision repair protein ERCC-6-like 2 isoform X2 n=1 Tax=Silurus meridionalis TaxID=175797 RepID=UPI001EEA1711|nr:DNA excision repair protein ERCC-6-like 2 isoform X2 [Silurus meridionalis]